MVRPKSYLHYEELYKLARKLRGIALNSLQLYLAYRVKESCYPISYGNLPKNNLSGDRSSKFLSGSVFSSGVTFREHLGMWSYMWS